MYRSITKKVFCIIFVFCCSTSALWPANEQWSISPQESWLEELENVKTQQNVVVRLVALHKLDRSAGQAGQSDPSLSAGWHKNAIEPEIATAVKALPKYCGEVIKKALAGATQEQMLEYWEKDGEIPEKIMEPARGVGIGEALLYVRPELSAWERIVAKTILKEKLGWLVDPK